MKCKIEVECTPQEARQFFGLPDLTSVQANIMAEIEKKMLADLDRFSADAMLKSWLSMFSQTPEQIQDAFSRMMKGDVSGVSRP